MATVSENTKLVQNAIRLTAKRSIRPRVERALHTAAENMQMMIDEAFEPFAYKGGGNVQFPVWWGDLHDGTGCGVYIEGQLTKYAPPEKAINGPLGAQALNEALELASSTFSQGFYVVLFSEAPHADYINTHGSKWGRGVGYMDVLRDYMASQIRDYLKLKRIL